MINVSEIFRKPETGWRKRGLSTGRGGQGAEVREENSASSDITVDAWFEFWIESIVGDLAPNTRRNYRERYVNNIQSVIGKMPLRDVRTMHCKKILIGMDADYAGSTIRQTYIAMGSSSCLQGVSEAISRTGSNSDLC